MAFTAQTGNSAYPWRPDVTTFAAQDVLGEALILQASVVAGAVEGDAPSVRVAYINDDVATFVAEASEIPEAEPELAECVIYTGKVSQLIRVSREQYFTNGTAEQLAGSVSRALTRKADEAFLTQAVPTPPATGPAAGLLNIPDTVEGDPVTDSLDALVDLVAEIQTNGGTPSHIIVAPDTWAALRKLKFASDSNQSLLGAGTTDAEPLLLSLPVIANVAVPSMTGLVIDRAAIVSAVGPVQVATSADAYFSTDDIGLRATWRIGQNIVRPDRVGTFTVGGGS
ncbi:MAG: phage major capsid protein [Mycobacterium sp.]|nr:phage major capsid protein [Mycobacterium sp.]